MENLCLSSKANLSVRTERSMKTLRPNNWTDEQQCLAVIRNTLKHAFRHTCRS